MTREDIDRSAQHSSDPGTVDCEGGTSREEMFGMTKLFNKNCPKKWSGPPCNVDETERSHQANGDSRCNSSFIQHLLPATVQVNLTISMRSSRVAEDAVDEGAKGKVPRTKAWTVSKIRGEASLDVVVSRNFQTYGSRIIEHE